MLCQKCQKNFATTHIKRSLNGVTTEMHLCANCAKEQGVSNFFGTFHSPFENLFGSLFTEPMLESKAEIACPGCGDTFDKIVDQGKLGCPQCYSTFYDRLLPSIERIHGKTTHIGKRPHVVIEQVPQEEPVVVEENNKLEELKKELEECVQKQEYEKCAQLRDQIRDLENQEKGDKE